MTAEPKNEEPQQKNKKKINLWKIAFLSLIGILIGIFGFLLLRITQNREPNVQISHEVVERDGKPVITIQTKKQKLNELIEFYLEDFQKDSEIKYSFHLENEAMLTGTFDFLGHPVDFYLYFEPFVMENGNIQLKAKSLSIGTLGLPIKEILKFAENNYKLPPWVEVRPDEKIMLVHLDQLTLPNGLFVKADHINLVEDEISFSIYLPKKGVQ